MLIHRTVQIRAHRFAVFGAAVVFTAACGGGGGGGTKQSRDTSATAPGTVAPPSTSSVAPTGGGGLAAPLPGPPPTGATAEMVALGDSIFHGQAAGGTCFTCHGADAKGSLRSPLVSHKWLTGTEAMHSFSSASRRVCRLQPRRTPRPCRRWAALSYRGPSQSCRRVRVFHKPSVSSNSGRATRDVQPSVHGLAEHEGPFAKRSANRRR